MWVIDLPTSVQISKNKRFSLNLNTYRNAHHHTLSKAKIEFDTIVAPLLEGIPQMDGVALTFTLFTATRQRIDTSNVCAIVDKFFCDTLVSAGRIADDNHTVVLSVDYRHGGYDKERPRVEVTIEPVGSILKTATRKEDMQITIVQADIETAIKNYILSQINVREDMEIDITLRATRGDEGYQAIIDIKPNSKAADPTPTPPKGSKTKSAEARTLNIAQTVQAAKTDAPKGEINEAIEPAADTPPFDAAPEGENLDTAFVADSNVIELPSKDDVKEAPETAPKSIFAGLKKPVNG
jgi:hypothetical protein